MFNEKKYKLVYEDKEYEVSTGKVARQASGSVMLTCGGTTILVTVTRSKDVKEGQDFFPLTVDYLEKFYASGRFPGGFIKRESRPSTDEILISRLVDRPIRPLFPEGFLNAVHVVITVVSFDGINLPENMSTIGVSLALGFSDIPFEGSVAGVTIGYINGSYVINPMREDEEESKIYLSIAGTKDAITMVEASSKEVSEKEMLDAILFGHEYIKKMCIQQEKIFKDFSVEKIEFEAKNYDEEIINFVDKYEKELKDAILTTGKLEKYLAIDNLQDRILKEYEEKFFEREALNIFEEQNKVYTKEEILQNIVNEKLTLDKAKTQIKKYYHDLEKRIVRNLIIFEKYRPDNRKIDEIRPLDIEIDILKVPHGSALFTRGETQALVTATLGTKQDEQIVDIMEEEKSKRFFLHYNFPPYSVGEAGFMRAPGRREIGHGNLAERALKNVMPSIEEFPYTVRVVSEITESNGSSSQASICGGSLALMAAGVPIKSTVAGIAMGLIKEEDNYTILTDIQGLEDHLGDMDFKVAGTRKGITAIQMDIKIKGINEEIMEKALEQALKGRLHIINKMEEVIKEARLELPENAPKLIKMNIHPTTIPAVIGTGGKIIKSIIEETGVTIDIEDDGTVIIYGQDIDKMNQAKDKIEELSFVAKLNDEYEGVVTNLASFGAFVEIKKGKEGLLHISEVANKKIDKIDKFIKVGDKLHVKVIKVDPTNPDKFSLGLVNKFVVEE